MTKTKHYLYTQPGAPGLIDAAGSQVNLLDAVLVNGFGLLPATSASVANGVVTITFASAHSFFDDMVAEVTGVVNSPSANGQHRVVVPNAFSIAYPMPALANGNLTGTISVKVAPAGWEKVYSTTNQAVYRSLDPASNGSLFRVNDTTVGYSAVRGFTSMSDLNTGRDPFPLLGEFRYWPKATTQSPGVPRPWAVVADSRTVYMWMHSSNNTSQFATPTHGYASGFGEYESLQEGDPYASFVSGSNSTNIAAGNVDSQYCVFGAYNSSSTNDFCDTPRNVYGLPAPIKVHSRVFGASGNSNSTSGKSDVTARYPNPVGSALILNRVVLNDNTPSWRGFLRGVYVCPQNISSYFRFGDKVEGSGPLLGKKLLAVRCSTPTGTSGLGGVGFFDISDW